MTTAVVSDFHLRLFNQSRTTVGITMVDIPFKRNNAINASDSHATLAIEHE